MEQNLINEQVTGFEDEQDKIDSESSSSMSSASDDEPEFSVPGEMMGLQPYQFEPVMLLILISKMLVMIVEKKVVKKRMKEDLKIWNGKLFQIWSNNSIQFSLALYYFGGNAFLIVISRIILVYYCKCCNLIGYSTRYLFIIR